MNCFIDSSRTRNARAASGQRSVFVLNADNTVSIKVVETGRHFGSQYEILSGLEAGEQVLTGGFANLRSGDKVEVQR